MTVENADRLRELADREEDELDDAERVELARLGAEFRGELRAVVFILA